MQSKLKFLFLFYIETRRKDSTPAYHKEAVDYMR